MTEILARVDGAFSPHQASESCSRCVVASSMGFRSTSACRRRLTGMILWVLPVLLTARVQAQDTRNEFWPELDVFLKLNEKSRLFFLFSATKLDQRATYADGSFGAHLDFYTCPCSGEGCCSNTMMLPGSKSFMLRVGYSFPGLPQEAPTIYRTHSHSPDPLALSSPGAMLLSDRNRVDFRLVTETSSHATATGSSWSGRLRQDAWI